MRSIIARIVPSAGALVATAAGFAPALANQEDPATPEVAIEAGWLVAAPGEGSARLVSDPLAERALERLYTARFHHEGEELTRGLQIVLAIPEGEQYIAGSATGPGAEIAYSVDGGQSFADPEALAVPVDNPGGVARMRRAGPEEYSHIRWVLPGYHPPGRAGLVSFRVRINATVTEMESQ